MDYFTVKGAEYGCGDMLFLFRILLPQCRGVVYTLALQVFINQWNAYLWPLLVTNRVEMRFTAPISLRSYISLTI